MGTHSQQGFTIIETLLVLAITAALIMGLLAGVGSSITIQRYRDSVTALKSFLQDQYSELDNVRNGRDQSWSCDASATPVQSGIAIPKGQSDCVLLGRYITIDQDAMTASSVIGYGQMNQSTSNEVTGLRTGYTFGISRTSTEQKMIEWGSIIQYPRTGQDNRSPRSPRTLSVLILRSPVSGSVYTFSGDTAIRPDVVGSDALKTLMVSGAVVPGRAERVLCIEPAGSVAGVTLVPEKMAVIIRQNASGPVSIETASNNVMAGASQC